MVYKVGYKSGRAYDPTRTAWRSDAPRPLAWSAWYPAAHDAVQAEKSIGVAGAELFRMGMVAEDAPLNADLRCWPVVVLSHGTGGSADGLCWLGRALAETGFVSIAISHHGNTAIEAYLPEGFMCWWERASDLSVILDKLAGHGPFADRLDLDRTFAAGFSLGGYTVLALAGAITDLDLFTQWLGDADRPKGPREFPDLSEHIPQLTDRSEQYRASVARHRDSYRDARIKAVVAMAPAPTVRGFEPASVAAINVPTRIIVGRNDIEAPHDECALWLREHNPAFDVRLLGFDVGHYVFLPEATEAGKARLPELSVDPRGVDRSAIHRTAAHAAADLFLGVKDLGG